MLYRKLGESIDIGNDMKITIVDLPSGGVRLGITAPTDVLILRSELSEAREERKAKQKGKKRV